MPSPRVRSVLAVILLALLGSALVLSTGCAPKLPPEPIWEKDARTLLDQADGFFARKQYDLALKTADTFMYQYPTSRYRDRGLYLMGDVRLAKREYERALAYYKEIIQGFPASSFILSARYKLGQCYFELKEYELAIANLADRSKVIDPAQLRRTAEMLSVAYLTKKNYLPAAKELAYLAVTGENEQQKAGYRDRVREIIEKNLSEDELKTLAANTSYPSDLALVRLAGLLIEHRQYRDAIRISKDFEEQQSLATHYARPDRDDRGAERVGAKFAHTKRGTPLLAGCLGHLECRLVKAHEAGDHTIFIGQVELFTLQEGRPLLFYRGRYESLEEAERER